MKQLTFSVFAALCFLIFFDDNSEVLATPIEDTLTDQE